ncbi:MAG: hypothetical protein IJ934_03600 [Acetobacter sp.]|nr:hypothetical protein [Acetobacter sp.]MBR2124249.1 hypothetical protein [Acetobacter sp.]
MLSQKQSHSLHLWKDTPLHRLVLATLINEFANRILTHHSSTATIEKWLRENQMAHCLPLHIEHKATGTEPPPCPPPLLCKALKIDPSLSASSLAYRKIHLLAEGRVFCIADNWYRPDILTPSMITQLETTDIPFGRVVRPLGFFRRILEHRVLWSPLPQEWQRVLFQEQNTPPEKKPEKTSENKTFKNKLYEREAPPLPVPHNLFEYIAILHTNNGVPFSALLETYTSEILNIPITLPVYKT